LDDFKKAGMSAAKALKILETLPKVDQTVCDTMTEVRRRLEFWDVDFQYETREERAVGHLSCTVEPGETVVLIGNSGSGRSTTVQLLQRFYEVMEGEITIDAVIYVSISSQFV
jgi:ABC-type multidrug transport system fused ATPase/permease subunit